MHNVMLQDMRRLFVNVGICYQLLTQFVVSLFYKTSYDCMYVYVWLP
jgi:hypothetical protein